MRTAFVRSLLLGSAALAAAGTLRGAERHREASGVCVEAPPSSPAPAGGWRAFRDPQTGKLREPTPEEAAALARRDAGKAAAQGHFEVIVHPDGMKSVDLKGAFSMSLVARRNADGSISYVCAPPSAVPMTSAPPVTAPTPSEK